MTLLVLTMRICVRGFELPFAAGTNIRSVRSEIGRRFGRAPDDVSLFFMGKALKDGFMIDRLRFGASKITVYLPDLDPLVLGTAKALRR
jgi:hypothetical protein